MTSVWYFYFLFVEVFTLFMHCSPDLGEHLYDGYFEFSVRKIASHHFLRVGYLIFILLLWWYHVSLIFHVP